MHRYAREWRGYRASEFPHESWRVDEDVLCAQAGAQPISLISRDPFDDFELTVAWQLPRAGNSGVMFRVVEDEPEPWQSGPEMQLLDDEGHPDGQRPETACGALYGLIAPERKPATPPERFHIARIVARGNEVEHWLNGERVVRYEIGSADFLWRAKHSKFGAYARFAQSRRGHIVLQHHGTTVWFRDLHIVRR